MRSLVVGCVCALLLFGCSGRSSVARDDEDRESAGGEATGETGGAGGRGGAGGKGGATASGGRGGDGEGGEMGAVGGTSAEAGRGGDTAAGGSSAGDGGSGGASVGGAGGTGGRGGQAGSGGATTGGASGAGSSFGGSSGGGAIGGSGAGAGGAGAGGTAGSGGAPALPNGVLIYYGHGGVAPPDGIFGFCLHNTLVTLYEAEGLSVSYTDVWPSTLSDLRLVVLALPSGTFSDAEVTSLRDMVTNGGVLYVQNEHSGYATTSNLNDLLARLGTTLRGESTLIGGSALISMELGVHPLLSGIDALSFADASRVIAGSGVALLSYMGEVVVAAEPLGAGYVVHSGDMQIIDDNGLADFPSPQADNTLFAENLAQL
jgi:hypothetical protein